MSFDFFRNIKESANFMKESTKNRWFEMWCFFSLFFFKSYEESRLYAKPIFKTISPLLLDKCSYTWVDNQQILLANSNDHTTL